MKISELIGELLEAQDQHGDIEVGVTDDQWIYPIQDIMDWDLVRDEPSGGYSFLRYVKEDENPEHLKVLVLSRKNSW